MIQYAPPTFIEPLCLAEPADNCWTDCIIQLDNAPTIPGRRKVEIPVFSQGPNLRTIVGSINRSGHIVSAFASGFYGRSTGVIPFGTFTHQHVQIILRCLISLCCRQPPASPLRYFSLYPNPCRNTSPDYTFWYYCPARPILSIRGMHDCRRSSLSCCKIAELISAPSEYTLS